MVADAAERHALVVAALGRRLGARRAILAAHAAPHARPAAEVIARARLLAAHQVAVGAVLDLVLPVMPPLPRLLLVRLRRLARRRRLLLRVRVRV